MAIKKERDIQLVEEIILGIENVKGEKINQLDLRKLENTPCDYFIVCSGNSNTQVSAIVNSVLKRASKALKEKGQVYQHEKFGWQHIKFKNVQPNLEEKYD